MELRSVGSTIEQKLVPRCATGVLTELEYTWYTGYTTWVPCGAPSVIPDLAASFGPRNARNLRL